jgi:hypothetical protein
MIIGIAGTSVFNFRKNCNFVWENSDDQRYSGMKRTVKLCFGSGFNQVSGFGSESRIRIQKGKKDTKK